MSKFFEHAALLKCPICGGALGARDNSLVCTQGHTFDVSRKGYVHFAPNAKPSRYDRTLFEARRRVVNARFYAPMRTAILDAVTRYAPNAQVSLDAGCGDGSFTRALHRGGQMLALDLSKDAIALAATRSDPILWMVADLTRMPVADGCVDVLFDLFSPAHYEAFSRVLTRDGILVKVVPQSGYLQEIRAAAGEQLRHDTYSNAPVVKLLSERFHVLETKRVTAEFQLNEAEASDFLAMTPLLFHVDAQAIAPQSIGTITVDVDVLVAKKTRIKGIGVQLDAFLILAACSTSGRAYTSDVLPEK